MPALRFALLIAFATGVFQNAHADALAPESGRILLGLAQSARVTLVRRETGEKLVVGGRPYPDHRYPFVVPAGRVAFLGDWDVHFAAPYLAATGSGGAGAGAPSNDPVTCRCDPVVIERARKRRPAELAEVEIALLCAGFHEALGQTSPNTPPHICRFINEREAPAAR